MKRMGFWLVVFLGLSFAFGGSALATDPGDPVDGFGDGGSVEISPEDASAGYHVGSPVMIVRPDGSVVMDIGLCQVDCGFSGVIVDPTGSWSRLERSFGPSANDAVLVDDGSVVFAGELEGYAYVGRFTPDLIPDPAWGNSDSPGVIRHSGELTFVDSVGDNVFYLQDVGSQSTDAGEPLLVARGPDGSLVGSMPPVEDGFLAVLPGPSESYLVVTLGFGAGGSFAAGGDGEHIAVYESDLAGGAELVNEIPVAGRCWGIPSAKTRDGGLIVAYTTESALHLLKIAGDGSRDLTVADPSLALPYDPCSEWSHIAVAELRTGEIVTAASNGEGHTQIDRFSPVGTHLGEMVNADAFPPGFDEVIELGVSPIDGHLLISGGIWRSVDDRSFNLTMRFHGDSMGRFVDDNGNIFEFDIEWIADEGITKGCNPPANDMYCPDDFVTRGQMAAFLVRAMGYTDSDGDLFVDDNGSTFEADINMLATAGVTKGCNPPANTEYCPDDFVTRGQMAAFLVRAMGYTDNGDGNLFTDDDGSTFEADIDKLGTAGVTKGCNPPANTEYCPNDFVTRGQMAAFLRRALEN